MHRVVALVVVIAAVAMVGGVAGMAPGEDVADANVFEDPPELGLAECAAEPPDDFADPDEDVLGWHDGYWYNEPLDIDTDDGLSDEELDAVIARATARWEALRCLPFEEDVPVEVIDRETFQAEHTGVNVSDEERMFDNAAAKALFMVGQDRDAVEVQEANRGETVGGFYDTQEGEIVLVSGADGEIHVNEPVLGHELGHALQDQHFGLEDFAGETTDEHNANLGIIEGDVVFTDTIYEGHCEAGAWAGECVTPPDDPTEPDLESLGLYLITIQPYSDGPNFVSELYDEGGWDAIDAVYEDYPSAQTEVMYPELYPDFEPDHPAVDDRSTDDWAQLEHRDGVGYDHFGEPVWFASLVAPGLEGIGADSVVDPLELFDGDPNDIDPLNPYNYSHPSTDGWVGDRFVAYAEADADDPSLAYTVDVAFEDADEAEQFYDIWDEQLVFFGAESSDDGEATHEIADTGEFDGAYHLDREGETVSIVYAPSADDLADVDTTLAADTPDTPDADGIPGPTILVAGGAFGVLALLFAHYLRRR